MYAINTDNTDRIIITTGTGTAPAHQGADVLFSDRPDARNGYGDDERANDTKTPAWLEPDAVIRYVGDIINELKATSDGNGLGWGITVDGDAHATGAVGTGGFDDPDAVIILRGDGRGDEAITFIALFLNAPVTVVNSVTFRSGEARRPDAYPVPTGSTPESTRVAAQTIALRALEAMTATPQDDDAAPTNGQPAATEHVAA